MILDIMYIMYIVWQNKILSCLVLTKQTKQ